MAKNEKEKVTNKATKSTKNKVGGENLSSSLKNTKAESAPQNEEVEEINSKPVFKAPVKKSNTRRNVTIGVAAALLVATAVVVPTAIYLNRDKGFTVTIAYNVAGYDDHSVTLEKGSTISDIEQENIPGYFFAGFYQDEDYTTPLEPTTEITENTTIYLYYIQITYKFTSIPNGVTITSNSEPVTTETALHYGDEVEISYSISAGYNLKLFQVTGLELVEELENTSTNYRAKFRVTGNGLETSEETHLTVVFEQAQETFIYQATEGGYTIAGLNDLSITNLIIPSSYNGLPVVSISADAFTGNSNLVSVVIPDSVTQIENGDMESDDLTGAFAGCENLESVTIGNGLTYLSDLAFAYCPNLTTVTLGENVQTIGIGAFGGCESLTDINLDNITTISMSAFMGCASLDSIELPEGLESIGALAFAESGLTSLVIPDSVTTIEGSADDGMGAFMGCMELESVTLGDGLTDLGDLAFAYCSNLSSITFGDKLETIGASAFAGCSSLTSITLPSTLTSIGKQAFYNCSGLTEITIPASVNTIEDGAFASCITLATVTIDSASVFEAITDINSVGGLIQNASVVNVLQSIDDESNAVLTGDLYESEAQGDYNSYRIALTFTSVSGGYQVSGYNGTSGAVVIPSTYQGQPVVSIGASAFTNNQNITSVVIPDSVTRIEDGPYFYDMQTYNKSGAFSGCSNLRTIDLGDGLTYIGTYAFGGCSNLTSIILPNSLETIGRGAFYGSALSYVVMPTNLQTISAYAFYYCSSLQDITIPSSVHTIGDLAFAGCSELNEIVIPSSVMSLGEIVFADCTQLANVDIQANLSSITRRLFMGCSNLSTITIPSSITSIGESAFNGCYALAEVYNYSSLTITVGNTDNGYVAYYAKIVYNASDLEGEKPESKIETINNVLYYVNEEENEFIAIAPVNRNVTTIELDSRTTEINQYAFYECTSLTTITIPDSVTSIGEGAFGYCTSLTTITIPNSVTSIGDWAFFGCSALSEVIIDSADIYNAVSSSTSSNGYLTRYIGSGETIKVLKTVVDENDTNTYLNSSFTRTDGEGDFVDYYVFTRN